MVWSPKDTLVCRGVCLTEAGGPRCARSGRRGALDSSGGRGLKGAEGSGGVAAEMETGARCALSADFLLACCTQEGAVSVLDSLGRQDFQGRG